MLIRGAVNFGGRGEFRCAGCAGAVYSLAPCLLISQAAHRIGIKNLLQAKLSIFAVKVGVKGCFYAARWMSEIAIMSLCVCP